MRTNLLLASTIFSYSGNHFTAGWGANLGEVVRI